jgi:hypothetical protein
MKRPPRHPEEYTDTDPKVMDAWVEIQRRMSPGDKLGAVLGASQLVLQAYEMGVRDLFPNATDEEVLRRVAARHLPRELMIRAYGWDPGDESHSI